VNHNKTLKLFGGMMMIILLLSACGPSAPPSAGEWKATSKFGEFTFTVDSTGTGITGISMNYQSCSSAIISGTVTMSQSIEMNTPLPIVNNKFSLDLESVGLKIRGTFSRDGKQASGSWTAGACSGRWKAIKSP